jgi:hypothetical protein
MGIIITRVMATTWAIITIRATTKAIITNSTLIRDT